MILDLYLNMSKLKKFSCGENFNKKLRAAAIKAYSNNHTNQQPWIKNMYV